MAWQTRGTADGTGTGTSVNVDVSGIGIQDGDWVTVSATSDGSTVSTKAIDDSGWTATGELAANSISAAGWHKVASTEPSSYTVSGLLNAADHLIRVIVKYDDAGGTITLDDADINMGAANSTTHTGPTVTTSDNGHVIDALIRDSAGVIVTSPSGTRIGSDAGTGVWLTTWGQDVSSGTHSNSIEMDAADGLGCITFSAHFTPSGGSAALTGTAGDGTTEADIVAGGQTVIITLTGDTWVASGATFDAQRQAIIDGFDSAQSEATGWNAEVRDKAAVTEVVRTSDTVVTWTIAAQAAYAITATETITGTIPGAALTGASPLTATPTFTVSATAAAAGHGWYHHQMNQ